MIDFHSHVLPHIDDGSRSRAESVTLLERLRGQGVDTVALTPHFYPQECGLETFLENREKALNALRPQLTGDLPRILSGAEVYYYEGISRLADLPRLCLEGTPLLLLEMPLRPWGEVTMRELTDLSCRGRMKIVLAHVERFLPYQKPGTLEELLSRGLLTQINADFLLHFSTKRRALAMLRDGKVSFLGSDCHNLTDRSPRIGEATDVIRKKLGDGFLDRFDASARDLLGIGSASSNSTLSV